MKKLMVGLNYLLFIVVVTFAFNTSINAQTPSLTLANVFEENGEQKISISFNVGLKTEEITQAENPSNYFFIDINEKKFLVAKNPKVIVIEGFESNIVELSVEGERINTDHVVFVNVINLKINGTELKTPLQAKLVKTPTQRLTPLIPPPFKIVESNSRQDSNVYISGEITGASGTDVFASEDIKFDFPFLARIRGKINTFGLMFDIKANTNPKADPDSLNVGFKWLFPLYDFPAPDSESATQTVKGKFYSSIFLQTIGRLEGERDFENMNVIIDNRFIMPLNFINKRTYKLQFEPFVGTEVGRNLFSPVREAQEKPLARVVGGTSMFVLFPIQYKDLDILSLEANYIRRFPLKDEVTFIVDEMKKVKPLQINTRPRDYVEAKLNLKLNKFFGVVFGYEYGELPPSFKLVDHRFKIGLVYKFAIDRKIK